jgi:hypothetical protein
LSSIALFTIHPASIGIVRHIRVYFAGIMADIDGTNAVLWCNPVTLPAWPGRCVAYISVGGFSTAKEFP